ncbi:MAG: GNAT family N-acetyltransferase [Candidatus Paceibacterota bacterium]
MEYKVRKFKNTDLRSVKNVLKRSVISAYLGGKITHQDILDSFNLKLMKKYESNSKSNLPEMHNSKYFRYVLSYNNRIIGICTIQVGINKNSTTRFSILRQLYLLPSFQGKGLGELLMKKSFTFSKTSRMLTFLEVGRLNKKAINFYERNGFKDAKKRGLHAVGCKKIETILMVKDQQT